MTVLWWFFDGRMMGWWSYGDNFYDAALIVVASYRGVNAMVWWWYYDGIMFSLRWAQNMFHRRSTHRAVSFYTVGSRPHPMGPGLGIVFSFFEKWNILPIAVLPFWANEVGHFRVTDRSGQMKRFFHVFLLFSKFLSPATSPKTSLKHP